MSEEKNRFPKGQWRLIIHGPGRGSGNMAVDEAIARMAGEGHVPPTLRLYAWDPPCISLGRHQSIADIDVDKAQAHGIDVVRRPTGGRAILHVDEITYSVAGPADEPRLRGMVLDCYLRLSEGITRGLERLGVRVYKADASARAGPDVSAACFEVPSAYEILTVDGRKIVGSAQVRKKDWVLQHGAIPLYGDVARLVDYLALEEDVRHALRGALAQRATSVEHALGHPVSFAEAAQALTQGFSEALNVEFTEGTLTPEEYALAEILEREVYTQSHWTYRI